jgi:dihydroorotate dehydrogenase electron transfer subunit
VRGSTHIDELGTLSSGMRTVPLAAAGAVRAEAVVSTNRPESGPNHRLVLRVPGWPESQPGQFAMLSPGAVSGVRRDDPLLPRPMAVFRQRALSETEAEVEILYKVEGRGTALLAQAAAGETVRIVGPLGQPFPDPGRGRRSVVVGGGTGVASLYGLVARLQAREGAAPCTVVLGARSADDLMARSDFEALSAELCFTTEDGSLGERGLVTAPLQRALEAGDVGRVYCCGPTPMMRACAAACSAAGVACSVSLENNMACGFGVCLGCAAPRSAGGYALVCRDGPVFEAADVDWDGLP